jgi:ABC-type bacteriocin/lantibiotic exporter with double-glycine peptidase domain
VAFKVIITAAMLIVGTLLLLDQQINIGQFVAAEIIIITIIASTEKIISNLDSVYDIMTAVEKIAKLTDKPIENGGTYSLEESEMIAISAKNLSFGYDDKPIFKDLNFDIQPGDKVCIKGRDGSGKSTLLKLLSGVYKDFKGQLLVNNVPIANYELLPLRKKMGILFQHENIFHGSLWENLTMDNPGITRGFINELCQKTGLQSFLSGLPHGYDTQLDPAGKQLPRSVVQKIMLVRALAHRPSLLILEEPFHGIEESFRHSIEKLILGIENTTVIVATADEQFANKCNLVIHLKDTSQ